MEVKVAIPEESVTAPVLNAGLEAVTRLDERLIEDGRAPDFSRGIRDGVRWQPEPPGQESFDHAAIVSKRGWGDCDDLAPWRAASLRVTGEDERARAVVYRSGPARWHAIVKRGDGTLEDPSQTAGMKVSRAHDGIAASVVGSMFVPGSVDGTYARPGIAVRKVQGCWVGRTDLPINASDYAMVALQRGASPTTAMVGSIMGACLIGGAAKTADKDHLRKLYALGGLLMGKSRAALADRVGPDVVEEAIETLAQMGVRIAGRPFKRSGVGEVANQA